MVDGSTSQQAQQKTLSGVSRKWRKWGEGGEGGDEGEGGEGGEGEEGGEGSEGSEGSEGNIHWSSEQGRDDTANVPWGSRLCGWCRRWWDNLQGQRELIKYQWRTWRGNEVLYWVFGNHVRRKWRRRKNRSKISKEIYTWLYYLLHSFTVAWRWGPHLSLLVFIDLTKILLSEKIDIFRNLWVVWFLFSLLNIKRYGYIRQINKSSLLL